MFITYRGRLHTVYGFVGLTIKLKAIMAHEAILAACYL